MAAPLVTVAVIGVGITTTTVPAGRLDLSESSNSIAGAGHAAPSATANSLAQREQSVQAVSRDFDRAAVAGATNLPMPVATGTLWTTEDLAIRRGPAKNAQVFGEIGFARKVSVTGQRVGGYAEIVLDGESRWVTAKYLANEKPKPPTPEPVGLSDAPCPDGSSIESGLQPGAVRVYRAVCAAFPELSSYGGQDGHGEHVNGEAIDFMTPSHDVGERVKDFLYANRYELDLFDIIWARTIWTVERDGEGFRGMSDRGSATANHYDHVHIKIN